MFYSYNEFKAIENQQSPYAREVFAELIQNITNPEFPCYYAKRVIPKNSLYVSFIENFENRQAMFKQAMNAFMQYAEIERECDPYRVFVLSFKVETTSWEEDNALMYDFMHYLNQHDPEPWFEEMPTDTNDPLWSLSFMGMPWFFNLNSPNNTHRKSRNVTNTFSLVLQRTDSFEQLLRTELAEEVREKQRIIIRKEIRKRIGIYDGQPVSPSLAGEADNTNYLEWIQFHLPDLNTQKPQATCPFKYFHKP